MTQFAYCNGIFIDENSPCISLKDRGFLFGDAVFTTMLVENGEIQFLNAHLERIKSHCLVMKIEYPKISLADIHELIERNGATFGHYRLKLIITGGEIPHLDLRPRKAGKVLMTLSKVLKEPLRDYRLTIFPFHVSKVHANLKTLSYLDRLWISDYALAQGFDEAIVLSPSGELTETAFSNIFWRLDQDIFVPDPSLPLFLGMTISYWIDFFKNQGFRIHYVKEKMEDLNDCAQIFICNAIKGVRPVSLIDKKTFDRDLKFEREFFKHV